MAPQELRTDLLADVGAGTGSPGWWRLHDMRSQREPRDDQRRLSPAFSRRYLLPFDTAQLPEYRSDVLVIGSGIAGLMAALTVSRGLSVSLTTKAPVTETGTCYAQGGIACAVSEPDSVELHLADTLGAGAGLCDERVVRAVVEEAPEALRALQDAGVRFDLVANGKMDLHLEGGHSLPRVLHSGDATGAEIQNTLAACVRSAPGIALFEERFLVDLLTVGEDDKARCVGALFFNVRRRAFEVFRGGAVILATGGCGQIYRLTTNPSVATGDGLAAAWRAGADVTDLEFVQFHPTAFDSQAEPKFLITEALRGEGARLLDFEQRPFMEGVHPLGDLAPRDVVAREIQRTIARTRRPHVFLDARHLGAEFLRRRFHTIWNTCLAVGCDLSRDLIPVVPAAHYMVGGIRVDLDGRTTLPGLFASGEVIASGLHGANRLASNSLLEGLVFSRRIARALAEEAPALFVDRVLSVSQGRPAGKFELCRTALQCMMRDLVGMTRSATCLSQACDQLGEMGETLMGTTGQTPGDFECQNLVTVAALVAHAARFRTESRGTHYREDFPDPNDKRWRVHAVWRRDTATRLVSAGEDGESVGG